MAAEGIKIFDGFCEHQEVDASGERELIEDGWNEALNWAVRRAIETGCEPDAVMSIMALSTVDESVEDMRRWYNKRVITYGNRNPT